VSGDAAEQAKPDRLGKDYACPQCGPDPRGEAEHAKWQHTWPPGDEPQEEPKTADWPRMARDRDGDFWIETPHAGWVPVDDIEDNGSPWSLEKLTEEYGPVELNGETDGT
jgi:hypothetical protein